MSSIILLTRCSLPLLALEAELKKACAEASAGSEREMKQEAEMKELNSKLAKLERNIRENTAKEMEMVCIHRSLSVIMVYSVPGRDRRFALALCSVKLQSL